MLQAGHYSLPLRVLQAELFYFETKKIGVGRSSLLRPGQAPHDYAAGGPFYFATKKIGVGRGAVATTTAAGGTVLLCRHDGAASILDFRPRLANRCSRGAILGRNRAVILDFRPRLANRCSQEAKTRANRASILDFRPRLANRCSREAKTRAILASILDFKPRLENRGSQKVKTGISLQPRGWSLVPRPENAGCADSAAGTLSTRHKKKSPDSSLNRDSRSAAATYSPTWCSSTIGASELNFSVRDGKRWILTAITAAI